MSSRIALAALSLSLIAGGAQAGCLTGAVVGGVAGHVAGHHTLLGAAGGCFIGHEMDVQHKKKVEAEKAAQREAALHPQTINTASAAQPINATAVVHTPH
jgi:uncharacterized protein YcfJ